MSAPTVDVARFVEFHPDPYGADWECVEGSQRRGLRGKSLGTLGIRHADGFAILLQLDDGRLETFAPNALRPDIARIAVAKATGEQS